MKKAIQVVAAYIEQDGKVLIAKRATGDKYTLGKWEFPGGKVEIGESEESAIEREIWEEFEMNIKALAFLTHSVFEYPDKVVDLRLYRCQYVSGSFRLHAHSEYKMVSLQDLSTYNFAPADIPLVQYLLENDK